MKTLYKNILYVAILALCIVSFHSCSEDKTFDFPGDPYNRVYMQDKSTDYKIVQTPISTVSTVSFETSLKCTQKASENINATVEIDNSMIEAFNNEHGTRYEAMPTSAILMENATMMIPAGAMAAIDTLRLKLTDAKTELALLNSKNGYLIPLRIATTKGGDAHTSTNVYTTYLTIQVIEDNVNHEAGKSDITGTLVADQSGWSATTNGSVSSWDSPIDAMFNGDMSTYCSISSNSETLHLDVDMGKQYTFDAITLYYGYDYSDWGGGVYEYDGLVSGMVIYTSNDGSNWTSAGEITSNSKFCVFYAPITAQYIRIVSPNYIYGGLFNVYENNF